MTQEVNEQPVVENVSVGDVLTGTVVKVQDKFAMVDVGFKTEGVVPIKEASNFHVEKVSEALSEGQEATFKVIKFEEDDLVLSRRAVVSDDAWTDLEAKYANGDVFNVEVKEVTKGGVLADVGVRGFIPISQLSTSYIESCEEFVGQTLDVVVMDLDREKNRVVLSHRQVLQQQKDDAKRASLAAFAPGQTHTGTVARLADFGAFVTLGDVDGLVHVSEIAHDHLKHPSEALNVGDVVNVKVLNVDVDKQKLSLSIKETLEHPWFSKTSELVVGQILDGKVTSLTNYGAFVEVLPGVEGLVHISQLSEERVNNPKDVVHVGDAVKVKVIKLDPEMRKISLSMKEASESQSASEYQAYMAQPEESFGVQLGDLFADKLSKFKK
ncbi:MAG: 30S ribosomal protein S1 [Bacilli bacterium]